MRRLGDAQPGRVWVDCASCKRSGRYSVAGLLERFGPDISTVDLLRHLTISCHHQRAPGSPPARKYEHLCLAAITLPQPVKQRPPVPPGNPYTIEVWKGAGSGIELHLAIVYPLSLAIAAFEVACQEWPAHFVTLRDGARIVRKQELPQQTSAAPEVSRP